MLALQNLKVLMLLSLRNLPLGVWKTSRYLVSYQYAADLRAYVHYCCMCTLPKLMPTKKHDIVLKVVNDAWAVISSKSHQTEFTRKKSPD